MTNVNTFGPNEALNSAKFVRDNAQLLGITAEDFKVPVEVVIPLGPPASATQTLVRNTKRYIVPFNGQFFSYPMLLLPHPTSESLFSIVQPVPDILREGLVFVGGEAYYVKLEDLRRGIVRKSRRLSIPPKRTITYQDFLDGLACTATQDLPDHHYYSPASIAARRAATPGGENISAEDEAQAGETGTSTSSRSSRAAEVDELEAELREIDVAFQEQIGALCNHEDSQEEWIDANHSQPE